jgi:anaerobic magnesium-protoporphyrin IX monomethyl ester cyclase
MKVVFVNPSLRPEAKRRQLPVGLGYILTAVKEAGFDFDLIDMDIDNLSMTDLERLLANGSYDILALGCIVTGFRLVRQIAEIAKKCNPEIVVMAGNSVATSIPEILLQRTKVDIAVMGEGDLTIVELLRALAKKNDLAGVRGIAFKKQGKILYTPRRPIVPDIDAIGFPDWQLFNLEKYNKYSAINVTSFSKQDVLAFPLNSARGCPYKCTFCYHVFRDVKYRKYSEEAIIEEIKRLHYTYGCDFISFWDELTFPTIKSVQALVNKLEKLDFKVGWEAPVRGGLFKKEHVGLIRAMREVGCDNIPFSLENASPEILKAMNKKMKVSEFVEQAEVLWEGGVPPRTSIIFGYPQETPETIQKTLDVCQECKVFPSTGFLLPLPGTPIYEWAKRHGHIVDEVEYLERIGDRQDFHINLTQMSDQQFVTTVEANLRSLAEKQGLQLQSVFKTIKYQRPKII